MTSSSILGIFGAIVVVVVLFIVLRPRGHGISKAPDLNDHAERAQAWLATQGYVVVRGRQEAEWIGYHDKDEFRKLLSVDYIVRKGADYYAVKLTHTAGTEVSGLKLREEWYPLWNAFGVKGIIHLDVLENQSHTIDFEVKTPYYVRLRRLSLRSGLMATGALVMFAWMHRIG